MNVLDVLKTEEVAVRNQITSLRDKQERLKVAIHALDGLGHTRQSRSGATSRIRSLMADGQQRSLSEIARAIPENMHRTSGVLRSLMVQGSIARPTRGQYVLVQTNGREAAQ
jgi:hypothetical protein